MEEINKEYRKEIDLLSFVKFVWNDRKFILKITALSVLLGLFIAFSIKDEFESSTDLLVEGGGNDANNLSSLSGLAGLAGISIGNNVSSHLGPEVYPKIVNSTPFIERIITRPVYFEKLDSVLSAKDYFIFFNKPSFLSLIKDYTIGLPSKLKQLFQSEAKLVESIDYDVQRLSELELDLIRNFKERIKVTIDPATRIMTISTEMPDPVASAILNGLVVEELTTKVRKYKTEKSNSDLDFVSQRLSEAKEAYVEMQEEYARFSNENRNISSALISAESQRIQNEMNLLFEVYKGLATQYQQLEIKVKEETPVFTVLEPAIVPLHKSSMTKKMVLAISIVVGLVLAIGISILKKVIKDLVQ